MPCLLINPIWAVEYRLFRRKKRNADDSQSRRLIEIRSWNSSGDLRTLKSRTSMRCLRNSHGSGQTSSSREIVNEIHPTIIITATAAEWDEVESTIRYSSTRSRPTFVTRTWSRTFPAHRDDAVSSMILAVNLARRSAATEAIFWYARWVFVLLCRFDANIMSLFKLQQVTQYRCQCRFHWCCEVECQTCEKIEYISVCKWDCIKIERGQKDLCDRKQDRKIDHRKNDTCRMRQQLFFFV